MCSARLDTALAAAITGLDAAVAGGDTVSRAAVAAYRDVDRVMCQRENADFGAADGEPHDHLASVITRHLRSRYDLGEARINRYGDPDGFDCRRFGR